jgi:hypothetical protein
MIKGFVVFTEDTTLVNLLVIVFRSKRSSLIESDDVPFLIWNVSRGYVYPTMRVRFSWILTHLRCIS